MSRMTSRAFVAGLLSIVVLGAWSAGAQADP